VNIIVDGGGIIGVWWMIVRLKIKGKNLM